jgi:hypothetical protein
MMAFDDGLCGGFPVRWGGDSASIKHDSLFHKIEYMPVMHIVDRRYGLKSCDGQLSSPAIFFFFLFFFFFFEGHVRKTAVVCIEWDVQVHVQMKV